MASLFFSNKYTNQSRGVGPSQSRFFLRDGLSVTYLRAFGQCRLDPDGGRSNVMSCIACRIHKHPLAAE